MERQIRRHVDVDGSGVGLGYACQHIRKGLPQNRVVFDEGEKRGVIDDQATIVNLVDLRQAKGFAILLLKRRLAGETIA